LVYSSIIFLLYFFPLVLLLYHIVHGKWLKNAILFISGLVFYFWGAGKLVVLLPLIGVTAWFYAWLIVKTRFKGLFLSLSVITLVAVLIWFKYLGFIIDNFIYLGVKNIPELKVFNLLGVSFFSLQAISYTIDVYRKEKLFEKNPLNIILYISMFPQLISGPFIRYNKIEQQLKNRIINLSGFAAGVRRFIMGLGKKILIADTLGFVVCQIVDNPDISISPLVAWAGMFVFAIQLFFDFSGYTDMAIGVGKMLGFELPENFNYPYISRSITEFWRRWHMSFTAWIKDYIFNPIAITLRYWGKAGISFSLLVTFFVCGIWHGTTWNFILWGISQGVFLVIEELFLLKYLKKLGRFSLLYVFFIILTCLVFFRTADFNHALAYYETMFTPANANALGLSAFFANKHIVSLIFGVLLCMPLSVPQKLNKGISIEILKTAHIIFLGLVLIFSIMKMVSETFNPFIYFNF